MGERGAAVMRPFNPAATCLKCLGTDIHAQWFYASEFRSPCNDHPKEEHIGRHCWTCAFAWPEAPADAAPAHPKGGQT